LEREREKGGKRERERERERERAGIRESSSAAETALPAGHWISVDRTGLE
jgi:hypothetical protein